MFIVAFSLTEFNKKIDIIERLIYNNTIIHTIRNKHETSSYNYIVS